MLMVRPRGQVDYFRCTYGHVLHAWNTRPMIKQMSNAPFYTCFESSLKFIPLSPIVNFGTTRKRKSLSVAEESCKPADLYI